MFYETECRGVNVKVSNSTNTQNYLFLYIIKFYFIIYKKNFSPVEVVDVGYLL